jgi:hypothetical protein
MDATGGAGAFEKAKAEHRARRGLPDWDANDEYMPVDGIVATASATTSQQSELETESQHLIMVTMMTIWTPKAELLHNQRLPKRQN